MFQNLQSLTLEQIREAIDAGKLLTVTEAAELAIRSYQTVTNWIGIGIGTPKRRLPCVCVGKRRYVHREDLEQLLRPGGPHAPKKPYRKATAKQKRALYRNPHAQSRPAAKR